MSKRRFAIIGAGTAGLASAIFLARAGHSVTIYERFPKAEPVGAGILLQPIGLAVLQELGLLSDVLATGARIEALRGQSGTDRWVMDIRYADAAPDRFALGVHRGNLFNALYGAAEAAGVEIICDTPVVDIEETPSGQVTVKFEGNRYADHFDAVIVADGTQSTLRSRLDIPYRCKPYPWGALWSIRAMTRGIESTILAQRYHRASTMIGLLPTGTHPVTGRSCVSVFWSLPVAAYARWQQTALDAWRDEVAGHWPLAADVIAGVKRDDIAFATYSDVVMKRWHSGNCVVIGDAAHGMSPQLGQGANLALVDAMVLADCVASAASPAEAFAMYSVRRRKHLRFYQRASRWLTPMFQSHSRIAAAVRDLTFPPLHAVPPMYRQMLRTISGVKTGMLLDRDVFPLDVMLEDASATPPIEEAGS